MKRINNILALSFAALLSLPMLSSCSQYDADREALLATGIPFTTNLTGATSRSTYEITNQIDNNGFVVCAFCPEDNAGSDGTLLPHCQDVVVVREVDGIFRGDGCRWPGNVGDKDGRLKFFAFHPSRSEMKKRAGVGEQCFVYTNKSKKNASGITYDYMLSKFRVAPDIAQQVDFVTAIGEGNKKDHLYSGIKLNFEHQLCGVNMSVWGAPTLYDVEIAGARIGGAVVEADFSLSHEVANPSDEENTIGAWFIDDSSLRGHVSYVYTTGDKVVVINANQHNTKDKVANIMGKGGQALVIPQKQGKWDYVNDKTNTGKGKGMYFSVLLRMTQRDGDHHVIFPSTDPESQDHIVFLLVDKSDGTVVKRLTKSEYANLTPPEGREKRAYGWAAVPVNVDWKAGYLYSYVLDFSHGVGVHDPADGNPASTIMKEDIGATVSITDGSWGNGPNIPEGSWGASGGPRDPDNHIWWR